MIVLNCVIKISLIAEISYNKIFGIIPYKQKSVNFTYL